MKLWYILIVGILKIIKGKIC